MDRDGRIAVRPAGNLVSVSREFLVRLRGVSRVRRHALVPCKSHGHNTQPRIHRTGTASLGGQENVVGRPRIRSDAFSAIMTVAACVLELTIRGITDESQTLSASTPQTFNSGLTTASSLGPMRHVPTWWYEVLP